MKTIIIGDVHGRDVWKDIRSKEKPDIMVFLGDYVSSRDGISSETQMDNLMQILSLKENNKNSVFLLRGNHDIQHLGYSWADCTGLDSKVLDFMSRPEIKFRFLELTQWVYEIQAGEISIICSHAGITETWMRNCCFKNVSDINLQAPCEKFGFWPETPWDMYGDSSTQPCTWIRPSSLKAFALKGYTQVVGHTRVQYCEIPVLLQTQDGDDLWLCDTLGSSSYLVLEDGKFHPRSLKE